MSQQKSLRLLKIQKQGSRCKSWREAGSSHGCCYSCGASQEWGQVERENQLKLLL